jgi:hypothetical protein
MVHINGQGQHGGAGVHQAVPESPSEKFTDYLLLEFFIEYFQTISN